MVMKRSPWYEPKKNKFVFNDRAADGAAKLIEVQRRLGDALLIQENISWHQSMSLRKYSQTLP